MKTDKYLNVEGLAYFAKTFKEKLLRELSTSPTFEHKCNNCGGTVEMDAEKHIFKCPYCGSVYAIGTAMVNDEGGS